MTLCLWTIGHSTRSIEDFLELLREHAIELLVDVRRFPASRRHPHFVREALAASLATAGIAYRHEEDLGGRRNPRADSVNLAWNVAGFRGYADYTATSAFQAALERLVVDSSSKRTAFMCAEALPERCHRRLIADVLVARGIGVVHILARGRSRPHVLAPHARVGADGRITYPSEPLEPPENRGQLELGL
jgi:uncharacterized protein (DUF488 family)